MIKKIVGIIMATVMAASVCACASVKPADNTIADSAAKNFARNNRPGYDYGSIPGITDSCSGLD